MSGSIIDKNSLNSRQVKNGMFNFIKTNTIAKNVQPKVLSHPNCPPTYNCSKRDLRDKRVYKASFRQPIKAVRKMTNCNENNNVQCQTTTKLYKDHYSLNDKNTLGPNCPNVNGSLPTGKLNNINLNENISKSKSGITTRTSKPLIRSGMQPNTAGQQNSGLNQLVGNKKRNTYSYSFRELLNNRRKSTVEKSQAYVNNDVDLQWNPSSLKNSIFRPGYGGSCNVDKNCNIGHVVERLNNKRFYKQGAVESSTRIENLKRNAIKGQSNCPPGLRCQANNFSRCNGDYFAGKPKNMDLNFINKNTKILYKKNEPNQALMRARGSISKKNRTNFSKNGICCDN